MTDITLDEATLWHVKTEDMDITDSVAFHGPPGTGKTTTAAATVGRLIRDHGYSIRDVSWVTYRRSLAHDTLQRLAGWDVLDDEQLNNPAKGATRYIGTAHAVGNRCGDIAEDPVEGWQRNDFCSKRDMGYWTSEPWEDSAGKLLFRVFDYLANANTTPEDTQALHTCPHYDDLRDEWRGDVLDAWRDWQDYKAQQQVIDFHEMLSIPLRSGSSPGRPILVIDEYHDVTQLMHDLFSSWMQDAEIVIVAGDPHQVVNAYDGASPSFFEGLDLPEVLLPKSWRVSPEHWGLATDLLANAHDPPQVGTADTPGLVNDINSPQFEYSSNSGWALFPRRDKQGSPAWVVDTYDGSTLFLARTQLQADGVGRALEAAGIPYRSQQDLRGWNTDRGETRLHLHNALQAIAGYSPDDFGHTSGLGQYQDGQRDPGAVEIASDAVATLLEAVNARTLDVTRSEADDICDTLRGSDGSLDLYDLRDWTDPTFWARYTGGAASVDRLNRSAISGDADREFDALRRALARHDGPIEPDDIDTWAITIHASKGMEADDVVVYDGVSQRILSGMQDGDRTARNEWRTWYVACSRPRKRLHIMRHAFPWTSSIIPEQLSEVVL
jgi:hypothetical protein